MQFIKIILIASENIKSFITKELNEREKNISKLTNVKIFFEEFQWGRLKVSNLKVKF